MLHTNALNSALFGKINVKLKTMLTAGGASSSIWYCTSLQNIIIPDDKYNSALEIFSCY
jgi:hypothetical protein